MNLAHARKILGIGRDADTSAVRRAYAVKLKALDVDKDIEGYADLREARDVALFAVRQQAAAASPLADEVDETVVEPVAETAAPLAEGWPYSAPVIVGHDGAGALQVSAPPTIPGPCQPLTEWTPQSGEVRSVPPVQGGYAFAVPPLQKAVPWQGEGLVQPGRGSDSALHALLYPGGDYCEEPMREDQVQSAARHQRNVLRDAAEGDLALHDSIETWLADTLAGAWPRSAPLLEAASAGFHWEREAGQLGERNAIAFLNARLKGLRFTEKVLDPAHRYHKAWMELSKPGRSNWFGRLFARGHGVETLLGAIRKEVPELEHHFDPQRVASWENVGKSGPPRWVWAIGLLAFIRLIAAMADSGDTLTPQDLSKQADPIVLQQQVVDLFGPETTFLEVAAAQPDLAKNLTREANSGSPIIRGAFKGVALATVRSRSYAAGLAAGGADLDTAMRLRLGHYRAARSKGIDACVTFMNTGALPQNAQIPATLRQQERTFARALMLAGRLKDYPPRAAGSASVPGELVVKVKAETGFATDRLTAALQDKGPDADRCMAIMALLKATLDYKGKGREEILKTL